MSRATSACSVIVTPRSRPIHLKPARFRRGGIGIPSACRQLTAAHIPRPFLDRTVGNENKFTATTSLGARKARRKAETPP